jgi:hypothetical protein
VPDVHVWSLVGILGREDVPRLDINPDPINGWPCDAVAMQSTEITNTASFQVQFRTIFMQLFCKKERERLREYVVNYSGRYLLIEKRRVASSSVE